MRLEQSEGIIVNLLPTVIAMWQETLVSPCGLEAAARSIVVRKTKIVCKKNRKVGQTFSGNKTYKKN